MPKAHPSSSTKKAVFQRAQGYCEYCLSPASYATSSFDSEHIIPRSRGGGSDLDNLALACPGCNGHKANKIYGIDPVDAEVVPLYNPRRQKWYEHFSWNEDYTLIIGLTPVGRATIELLQMNRSTVLNLRMALYTIGKHPPSLEDR